jgi:hypothetical protein
MTNEWRIQMVLNQYSVAASRRDWENVVLTFTAQGVWEIPSRECLFRGHTAIHEGLVRLTAATDYVVQQNAPGWIKVDGNTATAHSVISENGKVKGYDRAFQALGFYLDTLVRTKEGWRFERRTFELVSMRQFAFAGSLGMSPNLT